MASGFPSRRGDASEVLDIHGIYRRHGADIQRWAARLGGPLVDAEDIVQEIGEKKT